MVSINSGRKGSNVRDLEKENSWRAIFERRAASGKSARQFCKDEGLSEHKYYAWVAVIRKRDAESKRQGVRRQPKKKKPNPFVPIRIAERHGGIDQEAPIEVKLPGGASIRVTGRASIGLLVNILVQLEKSRC